MPEPVKRDGETRAHEGMASVRKPKHLAPAPQDTDVHDLVDISTKWYRNYFYFCATYCSPGPYAIAPSFETQFARLEGIVSKPLQKPVDRLTLFQGMSQVLSRRKTTR